MIKTTRVRAALAVFGMGAMLLACADDRLQALPTGPSDGPGIHPSFVVTRQAGDSATVELRLERVSVTETIASYQGQLEYDRSALVLGTASMPAGITGAWNETRPGVVRFTGVSVNGIAGGAVLVMTFATRTPVAAESLSLKMEEIASGGFTNLAPQLRQDGPHVRLTRLSQ